MRYSTFNSKSAGAPPRQIAKVFGYQRLGPSIREELDAALVLAVRRGILHNDAGYHVILARDIHAYDRDSLKEHFLAAIGRTWTAREDAVRAFARRLGFVRTGAVIDQTARSLIMGLLREYRLESVGDNIRRI